MQYPRRRRVSGRRRLAIGLGLLGLTVVALAGVGHLVGGAGPPDLAGLAGSLWHLLGVRAAPPQRPERSAGGTAAGPAPGGAAVDGVMPTSGQEGCVAAGATFVWTVDYQLCGCRVTDTTVAAAGVVGLTRQTLATELRDWEITSFRPDRVELRRTEAAVMCPKHAKRTLKLEQGRIVVYAGWSGDGVRLIPVETTKYGEADLTAAEAEVLRVGRLFGSEQEVVRYLEGLGD